jgi:DNA end-binding protein Ku
VARPIWSGAIAFGLVNIPVKLYSALSPKEVRFHLVHAADGGRIRQKRVCTVDDEEVPWSEVAKGYELGRGRVVMLSKEELEAVESEATKTIDIQEFCKLDEIDPIFYETTYHVLPGERAEKAYNLLHHAMERQGRVGIARFVMRTREYLCAVRPLEKGLALSTMQYADEIVPIEDYAPPPRAKPAERELAMAEQLIETLSAPFEPERFKDEHREKVLEMIEGKAEGQDIVVQPAPAEKAEVISLADALARSLERKAAPAPHAAAQHARRGRTKRKAS